ncbi:MAG: hypothetical protein U0R19_18355 [Bryobacteraceae bacterium]
MKLRLVISGICLVFFLGCSKPKQEETKQAPPRQIDLQANDTARFLAGIPGRPESPFHALEAEPAWVEHRKNFDRMWEKFQQQRLPAMNEFQEKEFAGTAFSGKTIFYPFGGPDVLTATTLFPKRQNYVLVGLEPPGTLPTEKQILNADLDKQLPRLERTLESLLVRSFFITASMDRELRGQVTDGLLQVMMVQLARRGYTIVSHQPVTLNEAGEIHPRSGTVKRNRGVSIEFESPAGGQGRILYLAANLNDKWLGENAELKKFLARSAPSVAFFKSTSYMPHKKEFSLLRDLVLQHCSAIVQDDSGIPYRYVDQARWDVRLFGTYVKPYGSFHYLVQPDLRKAYEQRAAPLNFRIGYGFGRVPSALQVFSRKS